MVKGNWERRAELAAQRRLESKEKKAARKCKAPTVQSIVHRLYTDESMMAKSAVELYLITPGDPPVQLCRRWLRFDSCSARKCKLRHDASYQTLSHIRNIDIVTNMDESITTDVAVSAPISLGSCNLAPKDVESIQLITVDGYLIYDAVDPEVYSMWSKFYYNLKSGGIVVVNEGQDEDLSSDDEKRVTDALKNVKISDVESSISPLLALAAKQHTFAEVLSYLAMDRESINLMLACKQVKRSMLSIDAFRGRLRECQTSLKAIRSRDQRKEKKRKQKNAFINSDAKKDNFARGGNAC